MKTHIQHGITAGSACGMGYREILDQPEAHAFRQGDEPTCQGCQNYLELWRVKSRMEDTLRTVAEIYLPPDSKFFTQAVDWFGVLDQIDIELAVVEAQVTAEMRARAGDLPS